jgi:pimeloyl-ACP methyl ester carboxylesterase
MKQKNLTFKNSGKSIALTAAFALFVTAMALFTSPAQAQVKNIVLVHGAFADGSGFEAIYKVLKSRGYNVLVVGNPDTSIPDDVEATNRVLAKLDGPCILVGHSYGGAIITEAGNSPKVAGLVYIAAFVPDPGHSVIDLLNSAPHDPASGILPPENGFVWYDKAKYHSGFCADIPKDMADFMADSQLPTALASFTYVFKDNVAWKTKPCWYIVAQEDHSIPPSLEREMGKKTGGKVYEIKASHLVFISHPKEVADIIEAAAKASSNKL